MASYLGLLARHTKLDASYITSGTLNDARLPTTLAGKTYNGLTLTSATTGFVVAGGTTSKTLTISNTLTLSGTDGSTLNVGVGGTLGTAAYTDSLVSGSTIKTINNNSLLGSGDITITVPDHILQQQGII